MWFDSNWSGFLTMISNDYFQKTAAGIKREQSRDCNVPVANPGSTNTVTANSIIREFIKEIGGETHLCRMELCDDGSVYVHSDEFELLVEFTEDAVQIALSHILAAGYAEQSDGRTVNYQAK